MSALPATAYTVIKDGPPEPWWRDAATIAPRQFLFGRHYSRSNVGLTIAGGGRGKTTLACLEAVSMSVGRDLMTGEAIPGGPLRVVMWNGEEDQDEIDRRLAAVCQRFSITRSDLGGRLFALSVRDAPLRIAVMDKMAPKIDDATRERMRRFISENRIDVFMVDPLVSFHSVPENDNGAMDLLVKQGFGSIARETNTAAELFHHPGKPKPGQAETTVDDGRGASAVVWAVRSARAMNFMTPAEGDKLGITEEKRRTYIRIANGKANMGPVGTAKWMQIEIENLPNGDHVACASSWSPPDPFENINTGHMELAHRLAQTGAYRDDIRSPDWFGWSIAPHIGINVSSGGDNDPAAMARLKKIIETWIKNKVLRVENRPDGRRKEKRFIVAGSVISPRHATPCLDDEISLQ